MPNHLSSSQTQTNQAKVLAWLLTLLIIIVGGWYLVVPSIRQLSKGGEYYLPARQAEYEQRQKDLATIEELIKDSRKVSSTQQQKLAVLLPIGEDRAGLFAQLEELALNNGLIPLEITMKKSLGNSQIGTTIISEDIQDIEILYINLRLGNVQYDSLKKLLKSFESNARLLEITGIDFMPGSSSANLTLVSYFLKEN